MPAITIKQRELFYQDLGTGFPVIFGHSFLWDSNMWQAQVKELSKHFRCIVPDLWEHGQSDHLPNGNEHYSVEELTDDYWQFIQALKIEKCAVIGLSVGGMWAAHLALHYPETIQSVVLMDTHLGSEPEEAKQDYFTLMDSIVNVGSFTLPICQQIAPLFFSAKTLENKPELVDKLIADLQNIPAENITGIKALARGIFSRKDILNQFEKITQPSCVIVGADDAPRPPSEARQMADLLPNSKLITIPDAGHIPTVEQPELVTQHLLEFLNHALTT